MDNAAPDEENGNPKRRKPNRLGLQITAGVLLAIGMTALAGVTYGLTSGVLLPYWSNLTDAQGSIVGSIVTLYAAALAAVVGPLIFTGQIADMAAASEQTLRDIEKQIQRLTEQLDHVRKLVRQTEEVVEQGNADFAFERQRALLTLESIREDATALAQRIVERSNKWKTTKDKTKRKWPGRRPYYNQLCNLGFITEQQRDLFYRIADTRSIKEAEVTSDDVDFAEQTLSALKDLAGAV